MKYIYGPVRSRRLGLSLGVSLNPYKLCNFDCIYCQLGRTERRIPGRGQLAPPKEILSELKDWLEYNPGEAGKIDYITICGTGEPTLNTGLGEVIKGIRSLSSVKLCLITNGSFFADPSVRQACRQIDLVIPSLDAVDDDIFAAVDRPAPGTNLQDIIEGLIALRKEFSGKLWLEVMLIKGVNDDLRHIKRMAQVIKKISPDKIQINSPVRATAEERVLPVEKSKLEKIRVILGEKCEVL